jgi:hypothetical protein
MLRRVTTAAMLRACTAALGKLRMRYLSWRKTASLLRVSDKTPTVWVIEALSALADWRCGRPVAPPVLRYRIEPGRR